MTFGVQAEWGHEAFIRWGGLTGFTSVLFGYFISQSRLYLRVTRFWILAAVLLAVHLLAFAVLLSFLGEWRLMWFAVMIFEYPAFAYLRNVAVPNVIP